MPYELIGIEVENLSPVRGAIASLGKEIADAAVGNVSEYLLNSFRLYVPYRYVPMQFVSERQRRWVFWAIQNGMITVPYKRTQRLSRGWQIIGGGTEAIIVNEVPYGKWVVGDKTQYSRHNAAGWWTISSNINARGYEIRRKMDAGVKNAIAANARRAAAYF